MQTASLKQLVAAALQTLKRSRMFAAWRRLFSPSTLVVEMRCARRIDALSRRLAGMQGKIATLSGRLHAGGWECAVDPECSLRRMLGELKDDLSAIRRDLALWHANECRGRTGKLLAEAIAQLNRVAADTYAAADRLVFDIEEHDRPYAR